MRKRLIGLDIDTWHASSSNKDCPPYVTGYNIRILIVVVIVRSCILDVQVNGVNYHPAETLAPVVSGQSHGLECWLW